MANLRELFDNIVQMQNLNGVPLAYGKMYVYALGRTRLMDTWSDVDGSSLNTNPIILDNAGQCHCYVSPDFDYTIVVCDAYDNEIFSLDKYLYSEGTHSHADVAMAPSESIAVSSYHVGETTVYVPYLTGDLGKVYTGIDPVNVDNVNDTISVSHVGLGLQEPLYFVEDSETACIIGCSAQAEIPSATSGKWEDAADTVIANSAQWGEDTTYEAGSYVDITDNTISVTGLQPSGDYADSTALDTKLDTTAFSDVSGSFLQSSDLEGYATESFVNSAVDSAVSGKLDSAAYAAQSGDFYLTSNPDGYITGVPSSYLQNSDLTIVDNKITEISGIELSAGDEFPQSATEAIEVVTANSGDWNNVTAKLDKADSGNFYPMEGNPSGFLTTETDWTDTITAASSYAYEQATAAIPAPFDPSYISGKVDDLSSDKLDATAFSTVSGDFITDADLTSYQEKTGMTAYIPYSAEGVELPNSKFKIDNSGQAYKMLGGEAGTMTGTFNNMMRMTQYEKNSTTTGNGQFPMADATYMFQSPTAEVTALQIYYGMSLYERLTGDLTSFSFNKDYLTAVGMGETVSMAVFTAGDGQPIGQAAVLDYEKNSNIPYLTEDMIAASAATWNTVTSKLDSTAFSTVSGSFLTSHQSLAESANWNSTYNTVHDNSASWTGGAAALPVSGSAGANSAVYDLYDMKLEYNLSSDGGSEPEHTYVQIDTNSINTYESYDNDQTHNEVNIYPGYIEFYNDGDGYIDFAGYDVINWQSTHETVSNNSASWGGGSTYTGDAQGALDEVYSNSANWNETYSAVSSNSADWNTVIDVSAGDGIVFNKVNNVVYIEADIRTGSI